MAFSDIEFGELLKKRPELVNDPVLKEYHHYLEKVLARVPHLLSESEEKLVMAKDQNGVDAWSQLQQDWLSTRTFKLGIDGEIKELAYGEIISYYSDPDREKRRGANSVVYSELGKDDILVLGHTFDLLRPSSHVQWRGYSRPRAQPAGQRRDARPLML